MTAKSQTPNLDCLGLLVQKENPDGNCWFYAVARQLYGDPSLHHKLRNELSDYFDNIAKDPIESEKFLYPNGRIDVNFSGNPRYANRNMPLLNLKKGDPIPALSIYFELTQIVGFNPPEKGEDSSPQEIAQAYANSLRNGMYAGDIESSLIHKLHRVVVRIFTTRGNDVIHTRTFDSIPNTAQRSNFYRKCLPPYCINLLYNGVNHYDSLVMRHTEKEEANAFGMNEQTYAKKKKNAENFEQQKSISIPSSIPPKSMLASFTRKKRSVINAIKSYYSSANSRNILKNVGLSLQSTMTNSEKESYLRKVAKSLGMADEEALIKKFKTTAGGLRRKTRKRNRNSK